MTWVLVFAAIEGVVRFLGAAFAGDVRGVLPLFVLDRIWLRFSHGTQGELPAETEGAWSSFFNSVRQQLVFLRHPILPDEVRYSTDERGEVMLVSSSRPKAGWEAPRVIRCEDDYYRLEGCSEQAGARPFLYVLRRLPAVVPGRTVISYSRDGAIARWGQCCSQSFH